MKKFIERLASDIKQERDFINTRLCKTMCKQYKFVYYFHEFRPSLTPSVMFAEVSEKKVKAQDLIDLLHSWYGYINYSVKPSIADERDDIYRFHIPDISIRWKRGNEHITALYIHDISKIK